jgi:hypothetical protein
MGISFGTRDAGRGTRETVQRSIAPAVNHSASHSGDGGALLHTLPGERAAGGATV